MHEAKTIAKLRIHVEREIRRIKEYHIFDSPVPLSMVGTVNQIYTVVCLLTNFQGPLILKTVLQTMICSRKQVVFIYWSTAMAYHDYVRGS